MSKGSSRTRKWTDKDGIEKYTTEIRADQMQMLGSRQGQGGPSGGPRTTAATRRVAAVVIRKAAMAGGGGGGGYAPRAPAAAPRAAAPAPRQAPAKSSSGFDDMDDDIPF